jgi:hypothetical protein
MMQAYEPASTEQKRLTASNTISQLSERLKIRNTRHRNGEGWQSA